jgi:small subunit ribosomal protein S8
MTDPIADFLTRIRNAAKANHKTVEAPGSKIKQEITKILHDQGYILAYKFEQDEKGHPSIKIALKYHPQTKVNAIKDLKRVSRPGLRRYASVEEMPRVMNGLGIAIVSTSKGIMTDKAARRENVGGEVLCYIF